jgi:hypothetical protein
MTILTSSGEGVLWATVMYHQFNSMVAGIITFFVAFFMIWLTDVSIILYDFSTIKSNSIRDKINKNLLNTVMNFITISVSTKIGLGLIFRAVLVVMILSITAPTLMYFILNTEISSEIRHDNLKFYNKAKDDIKNKYKIEISNIEQEVKDLKEKYLIEISGNGGSGSKGVGSISRAIKIEQNNAKNALINKKNDLEKELNSLTNLDNITFEKRYGYQLITDSSFNEKLNRVMSMMKNDEYKFSVYASEGIVGFIFLLFVMIKLFQPRVVGIYLNASVQDIYKRWINGIYDDSLPDELQSKHKDIFGAIGFEDKIYSRIKNRKDKFSEDELRTLRYEKKILLAYINNEESNLKLKIDKELSMKADLEALKVKDNKIFESKSNTNKELKQLQAELNEQTISLDEFKDIDIKDKLAKLAKLTNNIDDPKTIQSLLETFDKNKEEMEQEVLNTNNNISKINKSILELDSKLIQIEREEKNINENITMHSLDMNDVKESIKESQKLVKKHKDNLDEFILCNGDLT